MKRLKIILLAAFLLIIGLILLILRPQTDPDAPKYVSLQSQPTGPFGKVILPLQDAAIPFQNSKTWVLTVPSRTNWHYFFYDIEHQRVLGELLNAGPAFFNQDGSKLLCSGRNSPTLSSKTNILAFLSKISFGKIRPLTNTIQTFWILDLKNNSARIIGEVSQIPGTGSRWKPAPGFRYGYNVPNNDDEGTSFFLCDLDKETFTKIKFIGNLRGWWDERSILIKNSTSDFILFDVVTRKSTTLFSAQAILQFLSSASIPPDPAGIATIFNWNGRDYDLYFAANRRSGLDTNATFLIKVDRNGPALRLLYRNFKFEWTGTLDATATHYLYDGEGGPPGNGGNGGVFLRDLANNTEHDIVPPYNGKQYALSRFYRDSVIYSRDRVLWRVDLNGSNNTRLFPPPEK